MIIDRVDISKFRAFENTAFTLGEWVTFIAGQNGTQKSTLLGMLSQPFTITDENHPLHGELPLSGDSFRSRFKDKFRLSPKFDQAKQHEWTLHLKKDDKPFTLESIARDKEKGTIRFWRKGDRSAGSGYIQLPVIYLSLKRLLPLGEEDDSRITTSKDVTLTPEETAWFTNYYKKIMINQTENLNAVDYVKSPNKTTLGVSTETYDWNSNSAGQDNIGKILLAILSFKRLKEKFGNDYEGGILAIDEIDATLYPGSQIKLLDAFVDICKEYKIQIIATTHSLELLKKADNLSRRKAKKIKIIYLQKKDGKVLIDDNLEYERILHNLNLSLGEPAPAQPKLTIYTEDPECIHFVRALLGRSIRDITYSDLSLGCGNYIQLATRKVPTFMYPNSIVVLDGDAAPMLKNKRLKNFICLPGELNPEGALATFLHDLPDLDPFWTSKNPDYSKQHCFLDFTLTDILSNRKMAKAWYNRQLGTNNWGRHASHLYKRYLEEYPEIKEDFLIKFKKIHEEIRNKK
ncbi:AAA family ATPase [Vibrio sp. Vb2354]|uniref:AAA family ATPase n=1 Tax=unclassified Vibrio TaxID=2614977 RepID=UPI00280D0D63|nr:MULTISPECIES: AAA family ATPase [unclassified Vibrio]ELB1513229.1 AAA family ATPase [Vibrio alginolyticus]MDW1809182.1 AAA family ATPase [Vibrio sp. Vb2362]MDW1615082.1 AAA family ATPase [Vibrio sp. Vb2881]MDW1619798.1 AAA family ATPase [Vibrio sp. Vb2864]MDW1691932.1 AAA family ATPase [Vibrio sp. Vb2853]